MEIGNFERIKVQYRCHPEQKLNSPLEKSKIRRGGKIQALGTRHQAIELELGILIGSSDPTVIRANSGNSWTVARHNITVRCTSHSNCYIIGYSFGIWNSAIGGLFTCRGGLVAIGFWIRFL